jgi:hypothetical protein
MEFFSTTSAFMSMSDVSPCSQSVVNKSFNSRYRFFWRQLVICRVPECPSCGGPLCSEPMAMMALPT